MFNDSWYCYQHGLGSGRLGEVMAIKSKNYREIAEQIVVGTEYSPAEAISMIKKIKNKI